MFFAKIDLVIWTDFKTTLFIIFFIIIILKLLNILTHLIIKDYYDTPNSLKFGVSSLMTFSCYFFEEVDNEGLNKFRNKIS